MSRGWLEAPRLSARVRRAAAPPRGGWGGGFMNMPDHWPVYTLYMLLLCVLLASSLIDAELYIIPLELLWFIGAVGLVVHAIIDTPRTPGALIASPVPAALAAGG